MTTHAIRTTLHGYEREAATCSRKRSYVTKKRAARAAMHIRDTFPEAELLEAYECKVCGRFHLTKKR